MPRHVAIAVLVCLVLPGADIGRDPSDAVTLALRVYHAESGGGYSLHRNEPLHLGDRIQPLIGTRRASYVAIFMAKATGQPMALFPSSQHAQLVPARRPSEVGSIVELDDSFESFTLVAWFCEHPVAMTDLSFGTQRIASRQVLSCVERRHQVYKERPPARP